MWLAMNDALLANHAWFRRGLVHVDTCALCVIYSKTMLHVLHDYDKVMELWKSVRNSLIKSSLFQQSLNYWLEENLLDETQTCQEID